MVNTGLLILTNPTKINKLLPVIKKYVMKTLYIQYFPRNNIFQPKSLPLSNLEGPCYSQVVANIYTLALKYCNFLDVKVLLSLLKNSNGLVIYTKWPVELIIFDQIFTNNEINVFIQNCLSNVSVSCEHMLLNEKNYEDNENKSSTNLGTLNDKVYENVVLGGTFDRLHNGHKIFISEAILRCNNTLTIGVTDGDMLHKKVLWELIEPCSKRITMLKNFVEDSDPFLKYNIVPITDVYGPTKYDPNLQLIVVSEETYKGSDFINKERKERNLKVLHSHVVKLLPDLEHHEHEELKISSTNKRLRLLGTRLKQPNINQKPARPYVIGLTGGIASGKSWIADKLQTLGAGLINCDVIAHSLYEPGKTCYHKIIETFGPEYIDKDNKVNRKTLGKLVFNHKIELEKLNLILWPAIFEEAKKQVMELHKNGCEVIVIEAAVLIQAGWQPFFHEIWACIVPQNEAVNRLMKRSKLDKEEAKKRILVQPSNSDQVANAHVVISTLWSYEFTEEQVQKAWNKIMNAIMK